MKDTSRTVAICIATYQRPKLLARLLHRLCQLELPSGYSAELRLIENDASQSAEHLVQKIRASCHPFSKIRYAAQPRQNIALARNAAVAMGPADWIAFVDDDEEVRPDWLSRLIETATRTKADAVFGPVIGRFRADAPAWIAKSALFNKPVPPTGAPVDWKQTRTSNTLVRGCWFHGSPRLEFDPRLGRSGGSDSRLFAKLQSMGGRFRSCREAKAWEDVPPERASLKWLLKRAYRNGLIYERIVRSEGDKVSPRKRLASRCMMAVAKTIAGLPALTTGRPETCARALMKFALALGGLKEWLHPNSVERHAAYKGPKLGEQDPRRPRLAFLTNIVSPYRAPVFNRLAQTFDLRVFADAKSEFDRNWKVETSALKVSHPMCLSIRRRVRATAPVAFEQTITLHLPIGLLFSLVKARPETVISHELGLRSAIAALYCAIFRKRLIIWAYQSRISARQGSWRNLPRKLLLSRAFRVVGMGHQAREVLKEWGVTASRIVDAPNAANQAEILKQLSDPNASSRIGAIRDTHANGRKLAIVVGRLIPLKGISQVLESWRELPDTSRKKWNLVFIGDGPLSELIRQSSDPSIRHEPSVSADEIAFWHAAADLHIFPSCGDVWGLVVNEASHCGTPTLCSPYAGCYEDMILPERTGLCADFTEARRAGRTLAMALNRNDLSRLGDAARRHAAGFSVNRLASSFAAAANADKEPARN